jgi:hypothetical protein
MPPIKNETGSSRRFELWPHLSLSEKFESVKFPLPESLKSFPIPNDTVVIGDGEETISNSKKPAGRLHRRQTRKLKDKKEWYRLDVLLNLASACCFERYPLIEITHCSNPSQHHFCFDCARRHAEVEIGKAKFFSLYKANLDTRFCVSMCRAVKPVSKIMKFENSYPKGYSRRSRRSGSITKCARYCPFS